MPLPLDDTQFDNDLDAILRLQDVLLAAAEGVRTDELNSEYKELRQILLSDPAYGEVIPRFVKRHRDLGAMWPTLKSFSPQWEPRRVEVRRQFEPTLTTAERLQFFENTELTLPGYDSSAWTGASKPTDRVLAVRTLMPIAQHAVERLISVLEMPRHNGGPPLEGTEDALESLRALHRAIGNLLDAASRGNLADSYNEGFASEAALYAKRAAKALRDDPIPYAFSATILAVLSACGLPGIAGFLSGVAINMKRG